MAGKLTLRQQEVLTAISRYAADRGYPPTIRELGSLLGISSLRGVTIHLDALERKGWIERESTSRSIRLLQPEARPQLGTAVPLLGSIAAGAPLLAAENVEGWLPVPEEMARTGEHFALRVRGDSMIGDSILEGDIIVVRRQSSADSGEIVAALIGDEATVKRLDLDSTPPRLLPSNPAFEPIELAGEDVRLLGTVVGLFRNLGS